MQLRKISKSYELFQDRTQDISNVITLKNQHSNKITRFAGIFRDLDIDKIQEVWAVHQEYIKSRLNLLVPYIQQWKITKLYLWSNKIPNIIHHLKQIQFSKLKDLHLGWNNIESIEALSRLKMPQLNDLVLRDNKIVNVSCLKKCELPKLKILCLRGNSITTFNFQQWNFLDLEQLNINNNLQIIPAQILKAEFPKLKIVRIKNRSNPSIVDDGILVQYKLKFLNNKIINI